MAIAAGLLLPLAGAAETLLPSAGDLPFATVLVIQTRLDRLNLSCGCIDGQFGPQTRSAVEAWIARYGLAPTETTLEKLVALTGSTDRIFTEYLVAEKSLAELTPIPASWAGKTTLASMGYETILEQVAERCHASQAVIRRLNPGVPWPNPPAGTVLRVPNPFPAAKASADSLHISLGQKTIRVLDAAGATVALFPCTIAARAQNRPVGRLQITILVAQPNYTFDPELFAEDAEARTMTSKALLAPGPNNPVGTAWIGLDRAGYGIHGTPHPEDIGQAASHGCFRLANWNAEKLLAMVRIGLPVVVTED